MGDFLRVLIDDNRMGNREEDWDLSFDRQRAIFFVRFINWNNMFEQEFHCSGYSFLIAVALLTHKFERVSPTELRTLLQERTLNPEGEVWRSLCFNQAEGIFYVRVSWLQRRTNSVNQFDQFDVIETLEQHREAIGIRLLQCGFQ